MHARERLIGILLLIVALVVAGGAAAYLIVNRKPELVLDRDTCPPAPVATRIVFVDGTDLWPPTEQERITTGLLASAEQMKKYERLVLHVITGTAEDAGRPWKSFQRCKSADPNTVDPAFENERLVRAEYQETFLAPLQALVPELARGATAPHSPILESIEIAMWSPHFRGDAAPSRTLEIYSDLLQHSSSISQLKGPQPELCAFLASELGTRLKAHDWNKLAVVLHYLRNPRDASRQTEPHFKWWVRLFYRLGAAQVFGEKTLLVNDAPSCPQPSSRDVRAHRNR